MGAFDDAFKKKNTTEEKSKEDIAPENNT